MSTFEDVREVLAQTLQLDGGGESLELTTPLLGSIPEFDSMAVVTVLTAIEDNFGIIVDDDDITASTFETVGTLVDFVDDKI